MKIPDNKSFFLFGPRGTGKTTWVKESFKTSLYLDLLDSEIYNAFLANPGRLENIIPKSFKDWIVIDEVQKLPSLLNEVHRLIEKYKYKFVLTGSSARKLRKGGTNLLGGRALTLNMHPLSAAEIGNDFDLKTSLQYGMLPSIFSESDPKAYLESYIRTYMEEEIRQEGLTRNLSSFARFLEAASFSQASILNIASVARECSVERKTVEDYFQILEDLLIAYRIPVFTKKAKRRMTSHPKFFFFDTGVYRAIRPMGVMDLPEEAEGAAFESLFLQELIALNQTLKLDYKIFYWRTSNNIEVDFILYGERGIIAFELKRSAKAHKSMTRGLKSFSAMYPRAKLFIIYGGSQYYREGEIEFIPVVEAFKKLPDILYTGKYTF